MGKWMYSFKLLFEKLVELNIFFKNKKKVMFRITKIIVYPQYLGS